MSKDIMTRIERGNHEWIKPFKNQKLPNEKTLLDKQMTEKERRTHHLRVSSNLDVLKILQNECKALFNTDQIWIIGEAISTLNNVANTLKNDVIIIEELSFSKWKMAGNFYFRDIGDEVRVQVLPIENKWMWNAYKETPDGAIIPILIKISYNYSSSDLAQQAADEWINEEYK